MACAVMKRWSLSSPIGCMEDPTSLHVTVCVREKERRVCVLVDTLDTLNTHTTRRRRFYSCVKLGLLDVIHARYESGPDEACG